MSTYNLKIWSIREIKGRNRSTYQIRWLVNGVEIAETSQTRALAESHRAELVSAQWRGTGHGTTTPSTTWTRSGRAPPPSTAAGRLVASAGQPIPNNSYTTAWRKARERALTPAQICRTALHRRFRWWGAVLAACGR